MNMRTGMMAQRHEGKNWMAAGARPACLRAWVPACRIRPAFTVTELLIVIGIIVVMIALAVPAFNLISGNKSVDAANNQISALLGRARNEAIGLQEVRGVFFYPDPATNRYVAALVRTPQFNSWSGGTGSSYLKGDYVINTAGTAYYVCIEDNSPAIAVTNSSYWRQCDQYAIDLIPDSDSITLPQGVGLQMICDSKILPPAARASDGYLRCGAVLFDAAGRLSNRRISVAYAGLLGQKMGLFPTSGTPENYPALTWAGPFLEAQFGFVLFDREQFRAQSSFSENDRVIPFPNPTNSPEMQRPANYTTGSPEYLEEQWLDGNSTAILINRYNGSLVKGE